MSFKILTTYRFIIYLMRNYLGIILHHFMLKCCLLNCFMIILIYFYHFHYYKFIQFIINLNLHFSIHFFINFNFVVQFIADLNSILNLNFIIDFLSIMFN